MQLLLDQLPDDLGTVQNPGDPDAFTLTVSLVERENEIQIDCFADEDDGVDPLTFFFVVEKRNIDGINWDVLETSSTGLNQFTSLHQGLGVAETVEYQIKAEDDSDSDNKQFHIVFGTTTSTDTTAPDVTLTSIPTDTTLSIRVQTNEDCTIVLEQEDPPLVFTTLGTHTTPTQDVTFLVESLTAATEYDFQVTATDLASNATVAELVASTAPAAGSGGTVLTQHGRDPHTVFFRTGYECGFFPSGDPWVVVGSAGTVIIDSITPAHTKGVQDGAQVDPQPGSNANGFGPSQDVPGAYREEYDVHNSFPLTMTAGHSLAMSAWPSPHYTSVGGRPTIKTITVLTVLAAPPADGALRPSPYRKTVGSKVPAFTKDQIDLSLLPSWTPVVGQPTFTGLVDRFSKPWYDAGHEWTGLNLRPYDNFAGSYGGGASGNSYGRDLCSLYGAGAVQACRDDITAAQRLDLVANLVQIGLDYWELVKETYPYTKTMWNTNGGHASGRLFPILFAGKMLGNSEMLAVRENYPDTVFGEVGQTWQVASSDVGRPLPDYDTRAALQLYTAGDVGKYEWGIQHDRYPTKDNASIWAVYRGCCTGNAWGAQALVSLALGIQDKWEDPNNNNNTTGGWSHHNFFGYCDRYLLVSGEFEGNLPAWHIWWSSRTWLAAVWAAHRGDFAYVAP